MEQHNAQPFVIALPEQVREFVSQQAAAGGYGSPDEYVHQLVEAARKQKAEEELERLLLQGINSGDPEPVTPHEFEDIRREIRERLAAERKS
jgi:antitoxin ParD1/3/4